MKNDIIGQKELLQRFQLMIDSDIYPRFSILVGDKGSGKKTIARMLCKEISDGIYEECGTKIDEVRELIANAYKIHSLAVYLIPDADNMSNAAKNALLKVTEEPPNNAYFIMTLEDENNTLETIRSRATVFHMDKYSANEILEFAGALTKDELELEIIEGICRTPGEVQTICRYGVTEFYEYVKLVVDNIAEVSGANSFKIANKVALKDGAEGYDFGLFLKVFMYTVLKECVYNGGDRGKIKSTAEAVLITSDILQELKRVRGINKQMLIDKWILKIREVWM